jgi:hypothetical protein
MTAKSAAPATNIEDVFTRCGLEQLHEAIPLGDSGR